MTIYLAQYYDHHYFYGYGYPYWINRVLFTEPRKAGFIIWHEGRWRRVCKNYTFVKQEG